MKKMKYLLLLLTIQFLVVSTWAQTTFTNKSDFLAACVKNGDTYRYYGGDVVFAGANWTITESVVIDGNLTLSANVKVEGQNASLKANKNLVINNSGSKDSYLLDIAGGATLVVMQNLTIKGSSNRSFAKLQIRGNSTVVVGGNVTMQPYSRMSLIKGSIAVHGDFTQEEESKVNYENYEVNKNTIENKGAFDFYVLGTYYDRGSKNGNTSYHTWKNNQQDGGLSGFDFHVTKYIDCGNSEAHISTTEPGGDGVQGYFGPGGVGSILLPIELTKFIATATANAVEFEWETASELNNDYFTIEYSTDVANWYEAKIVAGAGTTQLANQYSTSVAVSTLPQGTVYFRLSQTDYDGTTTSFDVVAVEVENVESEQINVVVYPNPATSFVNIKGAEALNVSVINSNGSVENLRQMADNQYSVEHLRKGIYTLVIETPTGKFSKQLIKQ